MLKKRITLILLMVFSSSIIAQQTQKLEKLIGNNNYLELTIKNDSYMAISSTNFTSSKMNQLGLTIEKENEFRMKSKSLMRFKLNSFSDFQELRINNLDKHISPIYLNEDGKEQFASDEVFIVFKNGTSPTDKTEIEEKYNLVKDIKGSKWLGKRVLYTLKQPYLLNSIDLVQELKTEVNIEKAFVNWVYSLESHSIQTNDPYFDDQWNIEKVGLQDTWEIIKGSTDIVIAIVDEGVDLTHDDITPNLFTDGNGVIIGINTTDTGTGNDPNPNGNDAHGTASGGIAAGVTNNGEGVAGACWNCRIMPIQIARFDPNDQNWTYTNWIIAGINFAWNNGADIISNSWGGTGYDANIEDEFNDAHNAGAILVASSGNYVKPNYITQVRYPAAFDNVFAVGATKPNDNRKAWDDGDENNWGSCFGSELDIVAPGIFIRTTDISGSQGYESGDYTTSFNGTSSSAPLVSGTVGLMLSLNQNLTPADIITILHSSADKVPGMNGQNFTNEYGYGRLNALKAVYQAQRLAVQDQMVNFKSLDAEASGSNNGRRVVYEPVSSTYHTVFQSGSEIVYYKRPPWGSPSQPILISENQTSELGKNLNPNITIDSNGNLHVVWERKAYGSEEWVVYYAKSTNNGVTWSVPVKVSPVGWEPMNPQIVSYNSYYDNEMMLTYYYFDRIRAKMYNFSNNTWENWAAWSSNGIYNPATDAIPGTASYTKGFSSIASDRYGFTKMNIVYTDDYNDHIYYRKLDNFTDWGQLTNLSSIVSGSARHHSPSISNGPTYGNNASPELHVAWTRTTGSGSGTYDNKIIHRWTSDQFSWPNVYYTTYYQLQTKPTISGIGQIGNYKAHLIWEIQGDAGIARQYFNGSGWSSPVTITSNGKYPSLSTGGTQTKYFYTDEVGPFYDVTLSSQTLSKSTGEDPNFNPNDLVYKRSVSFMDSSGAFLEFVVHNIKQTSQTGVSETRNFKAIDQNEVDLSVSKALQNLNTTSGALDKSAILGFELEVKGNRVADLFEDERTPALLIGGQNLLFEEQNIDLTSNELSENSTPLKYSLTISQELLKDESLNILDLENYQFKKGVFASLGHIQAPAENYLETPTKAITVGIEGEDGFDLSAYPNPFNPNTYISFIMPKESFVKLKVFDLLGREVAVLINDFKEAGKHQVLFNASHLSSGVYLYRLEAGNKVFTNRITLIK